MVWRERGSKMRETARPGDGEMRDGTEVARREMVRREGGSKTRETARPGDSETREMA